MSSASLIPHQMQVVQHDYRRFGETIEGSHQLPHPIRQSPTTRLRKPYQRLVLGWVDPIQRERKVGEQDSRVVVAIV